MNLRLLTIDDYDKMYSLWLSCKGMGMNSVDDSREGVDRFISRNPQTCFCAEEGGNIIGIIMAGNDGRCGYIYHTAVAPEYRGRGIGTLLVEKAVEELAALGLSKVALSVLEGNESGNAFWEKRGFALRTNMNYRKRNLVDMTLITP
ncbi:MAG: GNAT family N-acetyltransferase [Firmicutes bacterium]|nr:GNAT family N-acetyltransferase [Bacillota bacterium]